MGVNLGGVETAATDAEGALDTVGRFVEDELGDDDGGAGAPLEEPLAVGTLEGGTAGGRAPAVEDTPTAIVEPTLDVGIVEAVEPGLPDGSEAMGGVDAVGRSGLVGTPFEGTPAATSAVDKPASPL